ncbi:MAG: hypothetical protein K1X66_05250 [Verrucomicrobiae bacterium]|nr:hypothetical protein [Verrucomicrobiae bacterium]
MKAKPSQFFLGIKSIAIVAISCLFSVALAQTDKKQEDKKAEKKEEKIPIQITAQGENELQDGFAIARENVELIYGETSVYADKMTYDTKESWVTAEGNVRIYKKDGTIWKGDRVRYNLKTEQLEADNFRFVDYPLVGEASSVKTEGGLDQMSYRAQGNLFSTENLSTPGFKIKPKVIEYEPKTGRYVMRNATVYAGSVPIFWFPYLAYTPSDSKVAIQVTPGYSSEWGAFLLTSYGWEITDGLDIKFHFDMRSERGFAGGTDLKWIYGRREGNSDKGEYGQGKIRFYYAYDQKPSKASSRADTDSSRYRLQVQQRAYFTKDKDIYANLVINKMSDRNFERDFFENEFRKERQPDNFLEVVKYDPNFTLTALARKQLNDFFETTEREPEIIFEMKRQRITPKLPLEYHGQSSFVRFNRKYSNEDADFPDDFNTTRFDTFHEISYPGQYFGWLNVTPRAGWRGTYYTDSLGEEDDSFRVPGSTGNGSGGGVFRSTFDLGLESSFKLSRTWNWQKPEWGIDRLRHVIEPFINFSYIPNPSANIDRIMQSDGRLPFSTRLQPLDFPQYNSIDSIDNQLITRVGTRQRWQTHRDGRNWNLLEWNTYIDIDHESRYYHDNETSNLYNDIKFRPVPWLTFEGFASTDLYGDGFNEYNTRITWQIARPFQFRFGSRYINGFDPFPNSNQFYLNLFWRINESWAFETRHVFEVEDSTLELQEYSIYRDFTSWRMAFVSQIRNNRENADEYAFYLTFTMKNFPEASIPLGYEVDEDASGGN